MWWKTNQNKKSMKINSVEINSIETISIEIKLYYALIFCLQFVSSEKN